MTERQNGNIIATERDVFLHLDKLRSRDEVNLLTMIFIANALGFRLTGDPLKDREQIMAAINGS